MDWQPIDTAPKDGTFFLVSVPTQPSPTLHVASWVIDATADDPAYHIYGLGMGHALDKRTLNYWFPTHWAPMPEMPEAEAAVRTGVSEAA